MLLLSCSYTGRKLAFVCCRFDIILRHLSTLAQHVLSPAKIILPKLMTMRFTSRKRIATLVHPSRSRARSVSLKYMARLGRQFCCFPSLREMLLLLRHSCAFDTFMIDRSSDQLFSASPHMFLYSKKACICMLPV